MKQFNYMYLKFIMMKIGHNNNNMIFVSDTSFNTHNILGASEMTAKWQCNIFLKYNNH